jgi:hypothetical protein
MADRGEGSSRNEIQDAALGLRRPPQINRGVSLTLAFL